MASIPNLKELPNVFENPLVSVPPPSPSLQYFNIRVTERLHRYRSLRRQWQEIATTIPSDPSWTMQCPSPQSSADALPRSQSPSIELKVFTMNESINPITTNPTTTFRETSEKTPIETDPLHSRIQQDLIQLRRLIKARQKKLAENQKTKYSNGVSRPSHESVPTATVIYEQETSPIYVPRESYHLNRMKSSQSVKQPTNTIRPHTFPQINFPDHTIPSLRNSSGVSQRESRQHLKQTQIHPSVHVYRHQIHLAFPCDSQTELSPYAQKKSLVPSKSNEKSTRPFRLPLQTPMKKKSLESLPQAQTVPSVLEMTTQRSYTYAASSSSFTPTSMKIPRNTSLLPILFTSITCVGHQNSPLEPTADDPDYHHLKNYQQSITNLPQPMISIHPRADEDEYAILLEQLDHIRTAMPDENVYDHFTRK